VAKDVVTLRQNLVRLKSTRLVMTISVKCLRKAALIRGLGGLLRNLRTD
jgi:hypothetical protein